MAYTIFMVIGILFIVIGICFLFVSSIVKKHYTKLFAICTERTTGKFYRFSRIIHRTGLTRISYCPVFRYTVNGQNYHCSGHISYPRTENVTVKDTVIYYNPNDPAESYTDQKTLTTVFTVFRILWPVLMIAGALLVLLKILVA